MSRKGAVYPLRMTKADVAENYTSIHPEDFKSPEV